MVELERGHSYEFTLVDGLHVFSRLTDAQWRQAFRTGIHPITGRPIVWMQAVNKPQTRITFEENLVGPQLP